MKCLRLPPHVRGNQTMNGGAKMTRCMMQREAEQRKDKFHYENEDVSVGAREGRK